MFFNHLFTGCQVVNIGYSAVQSLSLFSDKNSKLVHRFKYINGTMCMIEGVVLFYKTTELFIKSVRKWEPDNKYFKATKFTKQFFLCCLGSAVISAAIVAHINQFTNPKLDLQKIFKSVVTLSTNQSSEFKLSFKSPTTHSIYSWLLVNSIIVNAFLGYVSSDSLGKGTAVANFSLKILSSLKFNQQKFLTVERIDKLFPLQNIKFNPTSLKNEIQSKVEILKTQFCFSLPSNVDVNESYLKTFLPKIHKFTVQFFHESEWKWQIRVTRRHGQEMFRTYFFKIDTEMNRFKEFFSQTFTKLVEVTGNVYFDGEKVEKDLFGSSYIYKIKSWLNLNINF